MPDTAQAQVPRLVELVAWLSQSDSAKPVSYRAAAGLLGVAERRRRRDLDVLFGLSDEPRDWLASLRVAVVAQGFAASSRGPFRRPLHFTGEEGLALLLGLSGARSGKAIAKKLSHSLRAALPSEAGEGAYAVRGAPGEGLGEGVGEGA